MRYFEDNAGQAKEQCARVHWMLCATGEASARTKVGMAAPSRRRVPEELTSIQRHHLWCSSLLLSPAVASARASKSVRKSPTPSLVALGARGFARHARNARSVSFNRVPALLFELIGTSEFTTSCQACMTFSGYAIAASTARLPYRRFERVHEAGRRTKNRHP